MQKILKVCSQRQEPIAEFDWSVPFKEYKHLQVYGITDAKQTDVTGLKACSAQVGQLTGMHAISCGQ